MRTLGIVLLCSTVALPASGQENELPSPLGQGSKAVFFTVLNAAYQQAVRAAVQQSLPPGTPALSVDQVLPSALISEATDAAWDVLRSHAQSRFGVELNDDLSEDTRQAFSRTMQTAEPIEGAQVANESVAVLEEATQNAWREFYELQDLHEAEQSRQEELRQRIENDIQRTRIDESLSKTEACLTVTRLAMMTETQRLQRLYERRDPGWGLAHEMIEHCRNAVGEFIERYKKFHRGGKSVQNWGWVEYWAGTV